MEVLNPLKRLSGLFEDFLRPLSVPFTDPLTLGGSYRERERERERDPDSDRLRVRLRVGETDSDGLRKRREKKEGPLPPLRDLPEDTDRTSSISNLDVFWGSDISL